MQTVKQQEVKTSILWPKWEIQEVAIYRLNYVMATMLCLALKIFLMIYFLKNLEGLNKLFKEVLAGKNLSNWLKQRRAIEVQKCFRISDIGKMIAA